MTYLTALFQLPVLSSVESYNDFYIRTENDARHSAFALETMKIYENPQSGQRTSRTIFEPGTLEYKARMITPQQ